MNPFVLFGLVGKAISFYSNLSKENKQREASEQLLAEKYSLPPVTEAGRVGSQYGGGYSYRICSQEWEDRFAELIRMVISAPSASEPMMEVCGDIARFLVVLPGSHKRDEGPCYGQAGPYGYTEKLRNSDTMHSLVEMGRGLGGGYSLKIIQGEISAWLEKTPVEFSSL